MTHVAFAILAHGLPRQFGRLTRRLSGDGARVYAHVDAKADAAPFRDEATAQTRFLSDRVRVRWGDFGMVEATLRLTRLALGEGASHVCLLSGQDYPIRPLDGILRRIGDAAEEFINVDPMTARGTGQPIGRIADRLSPYAFLERDAARRARPLFRLANRLLPPRDLAAAAPGVTFYGGAAWWCLSAPTLRRMLDFFDASPALVALFRRAQNPDESFFQTGLMAAAADRPRRRQPTLVIWPQGRRAESPRTLGMADLPAIAAADRLFARKFDERRDAAVLDALDAMPEDDDARAAYAAASRRFA